MPPGIEEEFWLDTTDVEHFEMLGSAGIMQFSRLNDFLVELLAFGGKRKWFHLNWKYGVFVGYGVLMDLVGQL